MGLHAGACGLYQVVLCALGLCPPTLFQTVFSPGMMWRELAGPSRPVMGRRSLLLWALLSL